MPFASPVSPRALCAALLLSVTLAGASAVQAQALTDDPRVGLRAGLTDAGVAVRGVELLANVPRPASFTNPDDATDFGFANTDLAFQGDLLFMGNYHGVLVYDISTPAAPRLVGEIVCPGGQGDVSVYGNLLFMSVEETRGRVDCATGGVESPVSPERFRGVRIFDISNLQAPRQVAAVQSCRGSHTHTLVPDPNDPANLYVYISGTAGVRPGEELAGCAMGGPEDDASALFRIEVVRVPLAAPERAAIIATPRLLAGLDAPPRVDRMTPEARAAVQARVDAMRAEGRFAIVYEGDAMELPNAMADEVLGQIVAQRGGTGAPTAADTSMAFMLIDQFVSQADAGPRTGPDQCHDITVYPEIGLAGGACAGYGILIDIRDPANPRRIAQAGDENFAYWHSATFSNDGRSVVFTDEWGGGAAPRCRPTDRMEWGANALFTIEGGRDLSFQSYYKMPAAQTEQENCVAHNGNLVPVPGRDIMAQSWYQGGLSVFDFSDPANPVEIAYFDRGPISSERMLMGGYWSSYWYRGHIYASEIARGLDVFRLVPTEHVTAAEIAAAEGADAGETVNPQHQTRITWTASADVARAYLDQLARSGALDAARSQEIGAALATPSADLAAMAGGLEQDAARASGRDAERMRELAATLRALR